MSENPFCDEAPALQVMPLSKVRTLTLAAATIFTERLVFNARDVAARKAVDDACLIYEMVEKRLEEK